MSQSVTALRSRECYTHVDMSQIEEVLRKLKFLLRHAYFTEVLSCL